MKLLHLDSSILGETSVSRSVSAAIVAAIRQAVPGIEVVRRDLVAEPLAHLTLSSLPNQYPLAGGAVSSHPSEAHRLAGEAVLAEFLASDIVVIGAPMYNFTVPTQLKAWIDRIVITGKSFYYTPEGVPVGLCGDKRVIVAVSRGGFYGKATAQAGDEHLETYLTSIFRFIGVKRLEFVVAEGIQISPDQRRTSHEAALRTARAFSLGQS
jgi:FMN-dependent NADH-azoreductase